jgi:hypothetical protein
MKDEQIGGDALLKSLLVVLKYIKQRDPREKAAKIATAFRELKKQRSDIEEIRERKRRGETERAAGGLTGSITGIPGGGSGYFADAFQQSSPAVGEENYCD